jgi:hypothetical protein
MEPEYVQQVVHLITNIKKQQPLHPQSLPRRVEIAYLHASPAQLLQLVHRVHHLKTE